MPIIPLVNIPFGDNIVWNMPHGLLDPMFGAGLRESFSLICSPINKFERITQRHRTHHLQSDNFATPAEMVNETGLHFLHFSRDWIHVNALQLASALVYRQIIWYNFWLRRIFALNYQMKKARLSGAVVSIWGVMAKTTGENWVVFFDPACIHSIALPRCADFLESQFRKMRRKRSPVGGPLCSLSKRTTYHVIGFRACIALCVRSISHFSLSKFVGRTREWSRVRVCVTLNKCVYMCTHTCTNRARRAFRLWMGGLIGMLDGWLIGWLVGWSAECSTSVTYLILLQHSKQCAHCVGTATKAILFTQYALNILTIFIIAT